MSDQGFWELNTNEPPTVAEVIEFLSHLPPDATVHAYEGEGGDWILVKGKQI